MRSIAKLLLLLSVLAGLTLPTAAKWQHDAGCGASEACAETSLSDCADCHPCDHDPPAPPCPCDDEHPPADDPGQPHEHQHHHHHHSCACNG
ncbi:MAG: hypothetical protein HKO57_00705, partial [Akkermansiaceae bacterium]|nr:hypothetical protein [Akkermansiaceae bacterium]